MSKPDFGKLGRPVSSPNGTMKTTRATTRHHANLSNYPELKALSMPRILDESQGEVILGPDGSILGSARKEQELEDCIHGVDNTHNLDYLNNPEKVKSNLLQSFMLHGLSVRDLSIKEKWKHNHDITRCLESREVPIDHLDPAPTWKKSVFCPYKQERDHLGRILDSVSPLLRNSDSHQYCN